MILMCSKALGIPNFTFRPSVDIDAKPKFKAHKPKASGDVGGTPMVVAECPCVLRICCVAALVGSPRSGFVICQ